MSYKVGEMFIYLDRVQEHCHVSDELSSMYFQQISGEMRVECPI